MIALLKSAPFKLTLGITASPSGYWTGLFLTFGGLINMANNRPARKSASVKPAPLKLALRILTPRMLARIKLASEKLARSKLEQNKSETLIGTGKIGLLQITTHQFCGFKHAIGQLNLCQNST
jgi:hypothetical protein